MTRLLRQQHRILWMVLALLLLVGFIAAILVKPAFPIQDLITIPPELPEGKAVKSIKTDDMHASLYQLADSSYQIFLSIASSPASPITTLYAVESNQNTVKNIFIGKLDGKGTYRFPLRSGNIIGIILYDAVQQKPIQTLSF